MPRKLDATPASSRRGWSRVVGLLVVAAGLLLVTRTCVRQPNTDTLTARVTPPPAPAVANVAPSEGPDAAPAAPVPEPNAPRMRAMVFELDANGLHLRHSALANGRAKAAPISNAPRRLEFEVYGPDGQANYVGAFDHPLWQSPEALDEKGELTSVERRVASGSCFVRIPAELPATRIEFFEVDATSGNTVRQSIGSFDLP